jgi:hypothetical protein
MNETHCVAIGSSSHGSGFVCFFDEPFGEGTPFESAGGYLIRFDSGLTLSGPISMEDLANGLDAWLEKKGWKPIEEIAEKSVHAR